MGFGNTSIRSLRLSSSNPGAVSSMTVVLAVMVLPSASVINTEYGPAHKPVAVAFVCASGSSYTYVYGVAPSVATTVAVPSQLLNVALEEEAVAANTAPILTDVVLDLEEL